MNLLHVSYWNQIWRPTNCIFVGTRSHIYDYVHSCYQISGAHSYSTINATTSFASILDSLSLSAYTNTSGTTRWIPSTNHHLSGYRQQYLYLIYTGLVRPLLHPILNHTPSDNSVTQPPRQKRPKDSKIRCHCQLVHIGLNPQDAKKT